MSFTLESVNCFLLLLLLLLFFFWGGGGGGTAPSSAHACTGKTIQTPTTCASHCYVPNHTHKQTCSLYKQGLEGDRVDEAEEEGNNWDFAKSP